jgi:predicted GNAT family acetyltransferase
VITRNRQKNGRRDWSLRDSTFLRQFALLEDGVVVAWMRYRHAVPNHYSILHTAVLRSDRGEGIGCILINAVLDEIRARQATVTAVCPYVVDHLVQDDH